MFLISELLLKIFSVKSTPEQCRVLIFGFCCNILYRLYYEKNWIDFTKIMPLKRKVYFSCHSIRFIYPRKCAKFCFTKNGCNFKKTLTSKKRFIFVDLFKRQRNSNAWVLYFRLYFPIQQILHLLNAIVKFGMLRVLARFQTNKHSYGGKHYFRKSHSMKV